MPTPKESPFWISFPREEGPYGEMQVKEDGLGRQLVTINTECCFCNKHYSTTAPASEISRYVEEKLLIQDVFPEMEADQREIILQYYGTQIFICTPCQEAYWEVEEFS